MAHSVENGIIKRLSVSQVEKFDPTTPFGCNRRWWLRYVARLPEPQDASQELGEQVHAQIEHYLKTGEDGLGPIARAGKHLMPAPGPDLIIEHSIGGTELTALGIPFSGRIDLLNPRETPLEVLDWKTSSDIARYAKTPGQLRTSTQMVGYAKWAFGRTASEQLRLSHVYFQTRGRRAAEKITCTVDRETVTLAWRSVETIVGAMVEVARETESSKVEPNWNACTMGKGCPYSTHCPRSDLLSSLLDRFKTPADSTQKPVTQEVKAEPAKSVIQGHNLQVGMKTSTGATITKDLGAGHYEVLPPDAPKSDPALAADPVEGFSPVPPPNKPEVLAQPAPEPKKRGRPRKMPEIVDESTPAPPTPAVEQPRECAKTCDPAEKVASVSLYRMTIRHGGTFNLGNYQSGRVEVELEAGVSGDAESARAILSALVKQAFEEEAKAFLPKPVTVDEKARTA
jgi:hypothetical protein